MEYALAHPGALKGLVVSNMMSSVPAYNAYVADRLAPKLPPAVRDSLAVIEAAEDYSNPRYMGLLMEHYYPRHVLNMPPAEWPASVTAAFEHLNPEVYVHMQGPSEFGIKGDATLQGWDITARPARDPNPDPRHRRRGGHHGPGLPQDDVGAPPER